MNIRLCIKLLMFLIMTMGYFTYGTAKTVEHTLTVVLCPNLLKNYSGYVQVKGGNKSFRHWYGSHFNDKSSKNPTARTIILTCKSRANYKKGCDFQIRKDCPDCWPNDAKRDKDIGIVFLVSGPTYYIDLTSDGVTEFVDQCSVLGK